MRKPIDLTNQRFGYLMVIGRNGTEFGQPLWKCRCDCGEIKTVRSNYAGMLHNQGYSKQQIYDELIYCNTVACTLLSTEEKSETVVTVLLAISDNTI